MGGDDGRQHLEYVVQGSHRRLAVPLTTHASERTGGQRGRWAGEGLVVVPTSRSRPYLDTPATVADHLGWPLLLLCSGGNNARRVRRELLEHWPGLDVTAADLLHEDLLHAHDRWSTVDHWAARQRSDVDTNRKRNLGLAAARMTGRSWVLFLDDDVLRLAPPDVDSALHQLAGSGLGVASWGADYFPDNSVVHHARRDFLGLHQDVFLSGAALLVRLKDRQPPGFPPIYNEDWLFLYGPLAAGQVAAGPDIGQLSYDPYANPARAWREEFGDVLGEGLFHLLHVGAPVSEAFDGSYWRSVHAKRTKLLGRITRELRSRLAGPAGDGAEATRVANALRAIDESRKQLTRATPESLADFARRWQADEELWRAFLDRLPARDGVKDALVYLGLHDAWIVQLAS